MRAGNGNGQGPVGANARVPLGWWPWMLAGLFFLEVAFFWPAGLDQFLLPKEALLVAGVAVVLLALFVERNIHGTGRTSLPLPLPIAAFGAWALIAPIGVSRNLPLHLLGALELSALIAVAVLAQTLREESGADGIRLLSGAAALAVLLLALLTLLQALGLDPVQQFLGLKPARPGRWRILTTIGNPNWTAELLAAGLPLALAVLASPRPAGRWRRTAVVTLAVFTAAATGVTGSRGGLVALAAGVSVLWFLTVRPQPRTRIVRMAVLGLVLLAVGGVTALGTGASRWRSLPPITGRLGLWAAGGRLVITAPLRGRGLKQIELMLPEALERVVSRAGPRIRRWLPSTLPDRLDNDLLQTAVAGGIPAALLLLAIYGISLRRSWRRAQIGTAVLDAGIAGSLVALGIGSLSSSPLHTPATAVLFWTLVGLSLIHI